MRNVPIVKLKDLPEYLEIAWERGISVLIIGSYGVGKSEVIRQVARKHGLSDDDIYYLHLSQFDPVTLHGVPKVDGDETSFKPLRKMKGLAEKGKKILVLDEIDKARDKIAAATYQILLDRRYDEFEFSNETLIVAIANYETEDIRGQGFSVPQLDRVLRIQIETDFQQWAEWFRRNMEREKLDERVLRFLEKHQEYLWREGNEETMTTTSPRSWTRAAKLIYGINDKVKIQVLVGGSVGMDIAEVFLSEMVDIIEDIYKYRKVKEVATLGMGEKEKLRKIIISDKDFNNAIAFLREYYGETGDKEFPVETLRRMKVEYGKEWEGKLLELDVSNLSFIKRLSMEVKKQ